MGVNWESKVLSSVRNVIDNAQHLSVNEHNIEMVADWLATDLYNTSEYHIPHDYLEGATHYHATYVYPNWARHMQEVVKIQDHIFYK